MGENREESISFESTGLSNVMNGGGGGEGAEGGLTFLYLNDLFSQKSCV